jgi:hypothetical protein
VPYHLSLTKFSVPFRKVKTFHCGFVLKSCLQNLALPNIVSNVGGEERGGQIRAEATSSTVSVTIANPAIKPRAWLRDRKVALNKQERPDGRIERKIEL